LRIASRLLKRKASAGETKMKLRKRIKAPVLAAPRDQTKTVSQYSVIEERVAFQEAVRAFEKWRDKNSAIRQAIEDGATVERGLYRADIVTEEKRSAIFGNHITTTKLVIS
jgi:hypothetical protein